MPTLTIEQANIRLYQNVEADPLALTAQEERALITGDCSALGAAHGACAQRGWLDISHDIMTMLFRPGSPLTSAQKTRVRRFQDADGLVELKVDLDRGRLYAKAPGTDDNWTSIFPFARIVEEDEGTPPQDTPFTPLHRELFDLCADIRRPTFDDDDLHPLPLPQPLSRSPTPDSTAGDLLSAPPLTEVFTLRTGLGSGAFRRIDRDPDSLERSHSHEPHPHPAIQAFAELRPQHLDLQRHCLELEEEIASLEERLRTAERDHARLQRRNDSLTRTLDEIARAPEPGQEEFLLQAELRRLRRLVATANEERDAALDQLHAMERALQEGVTQLRRQRVEDADLFA